VLRAGLRRKEGCILHGTQHLARAPRLRRVALVLGYLYSAPNGAVASHVNSIDYLK
jgi:hypothetical protein